MDIPLDQIMELGAMGLFIIFLVIENRRQRQRIAELEAKVFDLYEGKASNDTPTLS